VSNGVQYAGHRMLLKTAFMLAVVNRAVDVSDCAGGAERTGRNTC